MYDLRLSEAATRTVLEHLLSSHTISFRVQLMDLDHHFLSNLTSKVIDGQVSVNYDGDEASRTAELAVFDPTYDLGFDSSEFEDGVWFFDRMIQIVMETYVPALLRTIEIPIFTGPVRGYKRKNAIVTLSCIGKDIFARGSWQRLVIKKGTNQITAIRDVLENLGETKFRFEAETTQRLKKDKVVDRSANQSPWGWCKSTAANLGLRLYYDGEGYACLRERVDSKPVLTLADGDGGAVLDEPDGTGDYKRIANVVLAQGPATGKGKAPKGVAKVPTTSAIFPTRLRRGGKSLYMGVVILRNSITSNKTALTAAKNELADRQRAAYGIAVSCLPIYMLEESDTVRIDVEGAKTTTQVNSFSFGLNASANMPVGYKKMVAPTLAKIRRL